VGCAGGERLRNRRSARRLIDLASSSPSHIGGDCITGKVIIAHGDPTDWTEMDGD
jgi:hypothetical protein